MQLELYDGAGTLEVTHKGRRYIYWSVPIKDKLRVCKLIAKDQHGLAFHILSDYADEEINKMIRERERQHA